MKNTNKSIFENYPDVVTVEQLASMLGISTKTAYKLVENAKIKRHDPISTRSLLFFVQKVTNDAYAILFAV